jgi:hypothetical protein
MLEFTLDVSLLAFLSGACIRSLTMIVRMLLADSTTLKDANSKKNKCKLLCYQGIIKSKQKVLEKPPMLEVNSEPLRKDL